MKRLSILRTACVFVFCAATATASPAQVLTTLHSFGGSSTDCQSQPGCGSYPRAGLVQASDGNFYGTTEGSGGNNNCVSGCGTVFKITPSATLTTLYRFCSQANCADGESPRAGLVQASDGNFYGTTSGGGGGVYCAFGCGTVFRITPSGTLTTLHSFNGSDGVDPLGALVQASDGNFYGTTADGGASDYCGYWGCGTVFKITPSGTLTTLYSFCSQANCADGEGPLAGLVQASDGNFYGTTGGGGANDAGTVFKITPSGTLTTLHSFNGSDGVGPSAALVQATDGNVYGTTLFGGSGGCDSGCGTVFKITPSGALTTLHSFAGYPTEGANPFAGLVQASDGNFYGTTYNGGANSSCSPPYYGCGTVFKITPSGTLTTLHSFNGSDGAGPTATQVQASDGNFYGTTYLGAAGNFGTVFRLVSVRPCFSCPLQWK